MATPSAFFLLSKLQLLPDGKYRYTAWDKAKSTSQERNGYRYIVKEDLSNSVISVYHNGKELLSQKQIINP